LIISWLDIIVLKCDILPFYATKQPLGCVECENRHEKYHISLQFIMILLNGQECTTEQLFSTYKITKRKLFPFREKITIFAKGNSMRFVQCKTNWNHMK